MRAFLLHTCLLSGASRMRAYVMGRMPPMRACTGEMGKGLLILEVLCGKVRGQ